MHLQMDCACTLQVNLRVYFLFFLMIKTCLLVQDVTVLKRTMSRRSKQAVLNEP